MPIVVQQDNGMKVLLRHGRCGVAIQNSGEVCYNFQMGGLESMADLARLGHPSAEVTSSVYPHAGDPYTQARSSNPDSRWVRSSAGGGSLVPEIT